MSIRTVIEINHDRLGDFTPETWETLVRLLKSCDHRQIEQHRECYGIKFLAQRHHSTEITVTCK